MICSLEKWGSMLLLRYCAVARLGGFGDSRCDVANR